MTLFFGAAILGALVVGAAFFGAALAFGALSRAMAFLAAGRFVERLGFLAGLRLALRAGDFFAADFLAGFFADFADLDDFFADFFEDFFELFFDDFFEAAIRFSCSPVSVGKPCPGSGIQAAWQPGC